MSLPQRVSLRSDEAQTAYRKKIEGQKTWQRIAELHINPLVAPKRDGSKRSVRLEAIKYATASVELEGFVLNESDHEHARRFVDGEISLTEFVAR
ncbi:MAG: antitoxin VbhA family protein [Helicobacteraceae bacterium]|jgi:hypothetical protein|nr:antitoxin VbhA family protein [Helicobacteraceae bacterium]